MISVSVPVVEIDGREHALLWHGTASANLASIQKHGLKPCGGMGADEWWRQYANASEGPHLFKENAVYLTANEETAFGFAAAAAIVTNSAPAVLQIAVPLPDDRLVPDNKSETGLAAVEFHGTIPPAWFAETFQAATPDELRPEPLPADARREFLDHLCSSIGANA